MAEWLWEGFESLVVLDTETTGIDPARERVIELAALKITPAGGEESFDLLVSLPEGRRVPPVSYRSLTGIHLTNSSARGGAPARLEAAQRLADHAQRARGRCSRPTTRSSTSVSFITSCAKRGWRASCGG